MQHPNKHTCNIRLEKTHMKHWKQKLATYMFNYCNVCNIAIYFCNFSVKYLQHTSKTLETLETYACNMGFEHNTSLLFQNGGSLAHGVHRCRAHRWRGDRRDRFSGEGRVGPRALEGHGRLAAPRDSHPRLSCVGARVFVTVLISHAPLALLSRGPPEPPFPPTRSGLEAVVTLLANRQLAPGHRKRSRRQRCRPQERRRTASWQPDARKLSGCLRAAARSLLSQRWGVEMRCRVRGG
jgi:hypothetical protein